MKTSITFLAILLLSKTTNLVMAQNCHQSSNHSYLDFKSSTITNKTGTFKIQYYLTVQDTTTFNDTFALTVTGFFYGTRNIIVQRSLLPYDTLNLEIDVVYDSNQKPFTPLEFKLNVKKASNTNYRTMYGFVFYNVNRNLEVKNLEDFENLPQKWPINPSIFSVDQLMHNNPKASDITDTTVLSDTQEIIYRFYDSLPYATAFVNSDTFNFDKDSTPPSMPSNRANGCGVGRKRFHANINNLRLFNWYQTDRGQVRQLWLPHAAVEICVNRWPDQVAKTVSTDWQGFIVDENGSRNFDFDMCAGSGRDRLAIFLKIEMKDADRTNKLHVKKSGSTNRTADFITDLGFLTFSSTPINISNLWGSVANGNNFELSLNGTETGRVERYAYGITYSYIAWAYKISQDAVDGEGQSNFPNLAIKIEFGSKALDAFYNSINQSIHYGVNRGVDIGQRGAHLNERTLYHEFGHFFTYHLHGYISWPKSGGVHTLGFNNEHEDVTMSEGLANGFAAIMDRMNYMFDNDCDFNIEEFRPEFRNTLDGAGNPDATLTSPYLSELYLAVCMLDLWDGENNYLTFGVDQAFYDPFNDDNFQDNIEISFVEIFKPLWQYKRDMRSIDFYYRTLVSNLPCDMRAACRRIWQFNTTNIDATTVTNTVNFPQFNTDEIRSWNFFNEDGKILDDDANFVKNNIVNIEERRNISELTGTSQNYNICKAEITSSTVRLTDFDYKKTDRNLSDDLIVRNGAILGVNNGMGPNFFWETTVPTANIMPSTIYTSICAFTTISIDNTSTLEIGTVASTNLGNLSVTNNARLAMLSGSKLIVNEGSKLTIEVGGILEVHPNFELILDGPNAILEIKGQLRIRNGATFTVKGGTNGFGKIIWYRTVTNWNAPPPLQIIGDANGKFILEGNGINHELLTVLGNDGIYGPANVLNEFRIKNCKILMDNGAKINPEVNINGGFVEFNNIIMDVINTGNKHNGIIFNGVSNNFENVIINNAHAAIRVFNWGNKNRLNVNGIGIQNCTKGIVTVNVPFNIAGGNIIYNTTNAISGNAIDADCYLGGVNMNNLNGAGVVCIVDLIPSTKITSDRCNFSSGAAGMYHFTGSFIPKCNEFVGNTGVGYSSFIWGKLFANGPGYNYWNNNKKSIHIEDIGWMNLHQGKNGFFETNGKWIEGSLVTPHANTIYPNGNSSPLNDITLKIHDNVFLNSSWVANRQLSPPSFYNYSVVGNYVGSRQFFDLEKNGYTTSQFTSDKIYICDGGLFVKPPTKHGYKPGWFSNQMPLYKFLGEEYLEHDFVYNINGIGVVNVYDHLNNLHNQFYNDSNNNYISILNSLKDVISTNYSSNISPMNKELIYYAYDLYKSALHEVVYAGVIPVTKETTVPISTVLTDAIALIDALSNVDTGIWSSMKYRLKKDKADLFTLASRPSSAISTLNQIETDLILSSSQQLEVNHWQCLNQKLVDVYYNNLPSASLFDNSECIIPLPDFDDVNSIQESLKNSSFNNSSTIKIFPNPAANSLSITNNQVIQELCIFNLQGKMLIKLKPNTLTYTVDLDQFASGIYTVMVKSADEIINTKIFVNK